MDARLKPQWWWRDEESVLIHDFAITGVVFRGATVGRCGDESGRGVTLIVVLGELSRGCRALRNVSPAPDSSTAAIDDEGEAMRNG